MRISKHDGEKIMKKAKQSKAPTQASPRRRRHDVVIWQEQDEWVVFDSVADKCYRFETEAEAVQKFKDIKSKFSEAETL